MNKTQKEIILAAALLLLGVFSWYFLKYIFYIGNLSILCWVLGIVLFIFWGITLCLAMLLINTKKILYGSFIITLIVFGMFFNNEPFYYFIGLLIILIAFWFAVWKIRQEEKVQINLNFWRIWKRGFPFLVTALILLIALIYYFSPILNKIEQREIKIPESVFNSVIKRLPVDFGLDKNEVYELVNSELNEKLNPYYKKVVPLALAVGLFLALRVIAIAYIALVVLLSWVFLRLLILLRFVKINIETKEVETIKL